MDIWDDSDEAPAWFKVLRDSDEESLQVGRRGGVVETPDTSDDIEELTFGKSLSGHSFLGGGGRDGGIGYEICGGVLEVGALGTGCVHHRCGDVGADYKIGTPV